MRVLEAARCGKSRVCSVDWLRGSAGRDLLEKLAKRSFEVFPQHFSLFGKRLAERARQGNFQNSAPIIEAYRRHDRLRHCCGTKFQFRGRSRTSLYCFIFYGTALPLLAAARGNIIIVITRNASFHLNYTLKHSLERARTQRTLLQISLERSRHTPRRDNKTMQILRRRSSHLSAEQN